MRLSQTTWIAATLVTFAACIAPLPAQVEAAPTCWPESLGLDAANAYRLAANRQADSNGSMAVLAASTATTPREAACSEQFAGPYFGPMADQSAILVSCWTIILTPTTALIDSQGTPVNLNDIPQGAEMLVIGCLQPDFSILAETVIWNNGGDTVMASSSQQDVALGNTGFTSWFVQSSTDPNVAPTGASNPNPMLNLVVGDRYHFSFANPALHPFALVSAGATPGLDLPLLVHGSGVGSLESDPGIGWVESGPDFFFTVTEGLVDAMNGVSGTAAAYRCNIHTGSMRGAIGFSAPTAVEAWLLFE